MEKPQSHDGELLAQWLAKEDETAFRALVSRYSGLVYMAAKRTSGGNDSLASEAAQLTFILLARKAKSLARRASLAGWLHLTATMQAKNLLRRSAGEARKRQQLQTAMDKQEPAKDDTWQELQPVLDDALSTLSEKDREVVLLRFYRALSIRDIARTLGIATDAAQKRIDRATERLRDKLTRRGVQAGGSLAVAITAGFAADAQAAVPVSSLFATKALAAATGGSATLSTGTFTLSTTAMKTISVAAPGCALLAAAIWLGSQFSYIATLEKQNEALRKDISSTSVTQTVSRKTAYVNPLETKPYDWEEVYRQLAAGGGPAPYLRTNGRMVETFKAMTADDLLAALDDLEGSPIAEDKKDYLRSNLALRIADKDPEKMLRRFYGKSDISDEELSSFQGLFRSTLLDWLEKDPTKATEWFDEKMKARREKSPRSDWYGQILIEKGIFDSLLGTDPAMAGQRLLMYPEEQRIEIFRSMGGGFRLKQELHRPYAESIRLALPEADHLNVITWPVVASGDGSVRISFVHLEEYFERIGATQEEREACILAISRDMTKDVRSQRTLEGFRNAATQHVESLREWVGKDTPGLVNAATARCLKGMLRDNTNIGEDTPIWPEVARIALRYHAKSGADEILTAVLDANGAQDHPELAKDLSSRLKKPAKR